MEEEIANTARVTPLVIVPSNQLDKVSVEGNSGLGVEDRRVAVTDEVSGDNILFSVAHDALERTLRGSLHSLLNLVVGSGLLEAANEIHDGNIEGGDTEGKTTVLEPIIINNIYNENA